MNIKKEKTQMKGFKEYKESRLDENAMMAPIKTVGAPQLVTKEALVEILSNLGYNKAGVKPQDFSPAESNIYVDEKMRLCIAIKDGTNPLPLYILK
jgi:hypothetical protein